MVNWLEQELREAGHQENNVRAVEARRAAVCGSEQELYHVSEQVVPRGVAGQGAVPSRREHCSQRAHIQQQQSHRQEDQSCDQAVCGHLSLLHCQVQVYRRRD